jgi:hypothetical protein
MIGGTGNDVIYADGGNDVVDGGETRHDHRDDRSRGVRNAPSPWTAARATIPADFAVFGTGGHRGGLADIAAATVAAHADPSGTHVIESLGITFTNFEDIEIS